MNDKIGFFQEDNGSYSSMRLMCFIALLASIMFGLLAVFIPNAEEPGLYLSWVFLTGAMAPKAIQKFAETK